MDDSASLDGRLIDGRYRLQTKLGSGGMGTVWSAHDEVLGREVAVKEVRPSPGLTPEQRDVIRQRTMREARAAARISHPSAVTVYDVVEDEGRPWIVMELLAPRTLADLLVSHGPLAPVDAARIGVDLIDALQAAHRAGVLHRDVKPANVMLSESGHAVLTDFGIATVEDDPALTSTGMMIGSVGYMSPERARGERPTRASDLWSLGATLFTAVEGDQPFRREGQLQTLHAVVTEPPPPAPHAGPLTGLIAQLLAKDPDDRPDAARTREQLMEVWRSGPSVTPASPTSSGAAGSAAASEVAATEVAPVPPAAPAATEAAPVVDEPSDEIDDAEPIAEAAPVALAEAALLSGRGPADAAPVDEDLAETQAADPDITSPPDAEVQPEAAVEPEASAEADADVEPEADGEPDADVEADVEPDVVPEADVQPDAGPDDDAVAPGFESVGVAQSR